MSEEPAELTPSGSPVYRHAPRETGWTMPQHSCENLEAISAHVEEHIGRIETVFHEIASDLIHLDVLVVPATAERPYHVLVTSGVSDEPMNVPDGAEEFRRAELLISLPPDWPLPANHQVTPSPLEDEANYWPIRWLKQIGRLPHEYNTWIGYGHSIPNGDPPESIANTQFAGVVLLPTYTLPAEFFRLATEAGDIINFWQLVPLYREEMDLKLRKGTEALEHAFMEHNIGFTVDTQRPNVGLRKKRFGLF